MNNLSYDELIRDFLERYWQQILAIAGFIIAIGGIIWGIIWGSRPSPFHEKVFEKKYFEYSSGHETVIRTYTIKLGKIPYLNKALFRKVELDSFTFFDATFRLFFSGVEERHLLEWKEDWTMKNKEDCKCIYLKKPSVPFKSDFNVVMEINRERTKDSINEKVKRETKTEADGKFTKVTILINNNWDMPIRNYEIAYPIPAVNDLEFLHALQKDEKKDIIVRDEDITLHFQNPVSAIKTMQNVKIGSIDKFILKVYLDIEPGTTEIAFRYKV